MTTSENPRGAFKGGIFTPKIKQKEMEVMKTMGKTTMSVQELSSQLGISLPKAYELVKSEGFPSIHIGTRFLIPVDAFREWLVITSNKEEYSMDCLQYIS